MVLAAVGDGKKIMMDRENILGCGGFSRVFKGTFSGKTVAVKRMEIQNMNARKSPHYEKELKIIRASNHRNIVQYLFDDKDLDFFYLAMELCECSLYDYFKDHGYKIANTREALFKILFHATNGLAYLHSKNIQHRDMKTKNLLVSVSTNGDKATIKLADFGICKILDVTSTTSTLDGKGTNGYTATELSIEGKHRIKKSDIFSLGIVFHECAANGEHPFGGKGYVAQNNINNKEAPTLSDRIKCSLRPLIGKMIVHECDSRPDGEEVKDELRGMIDAVNLEAPIDSCLFKWSQPRTTNPTNMMRSDERSLDTENPEQRFIAEIKVDEALTSINKDKDDTISESNADDSEQTCIDCEDSGYLEEPHNDLNASDNSQTQPLDLSQTNNSNKHSKEEDKGTTSSDQKPDKRKVKNEFCADDVESTKEIKKQKLDETTSEEASTVPEENVTRMEKKRKPNPSTPEEFEQYASSEFVRKIFPNTVKPHLLMCNVEKLAYHNQFPKAKKAFGTLLEQFEFQSDPHSSNLLKHAESSIENRNALRAGLFQTVAALKLAKEKAKPDDKSFSASQVVFDLFLLVEKLTNPKNEKQPVVKQNLLKGGAHAPDIAKFLLDLMLKIYMKCCKDDDDSTAGVKRNAYALSWIAIGFLKTNDHRSAFENSEKAKRLLEDSFSSSECEKEQTYINLLQTMGVCLRKMRKYKKAVEILEKAGEAALKVESYKGDQQKTAVKYIGSELKEAKYWMERTNQRGIK